MPPILYPNGRFQPPAQPSFPHDGICTNMEANPTARNFAGRAPKRRLYSHPLKRTPVEPGSSGSAPARQGGPKKTLGNSVMVAQLTLDQLVKVRILIPQLALFVDDS